ncbi:ferric uptake regulation protein [Escherichia coli 2722950]|nr:ferric uptake regulation protein [Escherichia coli 2722950]
MTDNNTALKKAGLKVTLPRLKILEVLQEPDNHHVSAEDLYKRLIDMGEEIGLATVYRVLNRLPPLVSSPATILKAVNPYLN